MITAEVIEDAPVLIPNKEHNNFTATDETLPKGSIIFGEFKTIRGKRRGEPFDYKLFITNNNEIIYQKKINPMGTTQVYLSADSQQTPTVVDVSSKKSNFTMMTIAGAVVGGMVGNYYARTQGGNRNVMLVGGALLGFFIARYFEKRRAVRVQPSK